MSIKLKHKIRYCKVVVLNLIIVLDIITILKTMLIHLILCSSQLRDWVLNRPIVIIALNIISNLIITYPSIIVNIISQLKKNL